MSETGTGERAIRTIVAAIALENGDGPVARRAIRLAAGHGARLVLAHAVESLPAPDPDLPPPAKEHAVSGVLTADAAAALERMAVSAGVQVEIEVGVGKAGPFIERLVRDRAADLLVIGPGKPRNLRERLFGSTADHLARSGPCPVLVVRGEADHPYRRAAAAIDFSPMSLAAARAAAHIAPEATLDLVHALEIPLAFEQAMRKAGTPQAEIDRYRLARVAAARRALRAVRAGLSMPKPGKIRIVRGDAAAVLVRLARSGRIDLVALGAQGRSAVSDMVLGSVARRVLAASSCDVLLT